MKSRCSKRRCKGSIEAPVIRFPADQLETSTYAGDLSLLPLREKVAEGRMRGRFRLAALPAVETTPHPQPLSRKGRGESVRIDRKRIDQPETV